MTSTAPSLPWRRDDRAANVRAYARWRSGHMTRRAGQTRHPKVAHRWYLAARWHMRHLNAKHLAEAASGAQRWEVYPCRWCDDYRDGETAKLHYHVGRRKAGS